MAVWKLYNPSPVGRNVGDCSVRAISKALDTDWETAYALIAMNGYLMGDMPSSNAVIMATLRQHGFNRAIIPDKCPDCYTANDFLDDHPKGVYVLGFGNHIATGIDGVLYDSWNSLNEIPIYYFYKKE